jgi:outer membrane protein TolC
LAVAVKSLESAQALQKAEKAEMFSPRVDLAIQRGRNDDLMASSKTYGNSIGLVFSMPLKPSGFSYTAATKKEIEARRRDFDKVREKLKFTVEDELYPNLMEFIRMDKLYQEQYASSQGQVEDFARRLESREPVMSHALKALARHDGEFSGAISTKLNIVILKPLIRPL